MEEEKKDFICIWGGLTFPTEIRKVGNLEVQTGTSYPASHFSNGDSDKDKAITFLTIEDLTGKRATFLKPKQYFGRRNAYGIVWEGDPQELIGVLEGAIQTLRKQVKLPYMDRLKAYIAKLNVHNPEGLLKLYLRR